MYVYITFLSQFFFKTGIIVPVLADYNSIHTKNNKVCFRTFYISKCFKSNEKVKELKDFFTTCALRQIKLFLIS